jgi:hypothetical protein
MEYINIKKYHTPSLCNNKMFKTSLDIKDAHRRKGKKKGVQEKDKKPSNTNKPPSMTTPSLRVRALQSDVSKKVTMHKVLDN